MTTRREFIGGMGALAGAMALPGSFACAQPAPTRPGDLEPPLPKGVFRRLGSGRFRTAEAFTSLQFSPEGRFLLAYLPNKDCRVWDVSTGRVVASIPFSQMSVHARCMNTFGEYLVITEQNGGFALETIDLATGKTIERRPWLGIGVGGKFRYQFDPRGKRLLAHSDESTYAVDLATRTILWQQPPMPTALFSGDGRRILTTWRKERITALDAATGVVVGELDPEDFVPAAYSHDGSRVLLSKVAGTYTVLQMQDISLHDELWRANVGEGTVGGYAFSPDGTKALYVSGDPLRWQVIEAATEKQVQTFKGSHQAAAFSPDSKTVATFAFGRIAFFNADIGKLTEQNVEDYGDWARPHFVTNTRIQLTDRSLEEKTSDTWLHFDTFAELKSAVNLPKGGDTYFPIALAPDEKTYLYNGSLGLELYKSWDSSRIRTIVPRSKAEGMAFRHCRWSRTGRTILIPSLDGLHLVSLDDEGYRHIPIGPGTRDFRVVDLRVDRNDRTAVVLHFDSLDDGSQVRTMNLYVYDLVKGTCRKVSSDYHELLGLVADGRRALVGKTINVPASPVDEYYALDLNTHRETRLCCEGTALELSPDGRTVVFRTLSNFQYFLNIFEIASQSIRWRSSPTQFHAGATLSPDGRTLLSQHVDAPIFLWDVYGEKTDPQPKPVAATLKQLSDPYGEAAFPAIRQLVQHPDEAVALLKTHLKPAVELTARETAQAIEELGHRDFRTREAAQAWLADRADIAVAAMRAALIEGEPNPERQRRLETILGNAQRPTKRILGDLRALEALEVIHTDAAKIIVASAAAGLPEAILTCEAAAVIARW